MNTRLSHALPAGPSHPASFRPALRHWGRRLLFVAWAALTVWLACAKWGTRPRLQLSVLLAQRHCLSFTEPADRVVLELNPARSQPLLKSNGYRAVRAFGFEANPPPAAVSDVASRRLDELSAATECLDGWQRLRHPPPPAPPPFLLQIEFDVRDHTPSDSFVLFLHRLRSPGKSERLVVLNADWYDYWGNTLSLYATALAPASLTGEVQALSIWPGEAGPPLHLDGTGLRLYAGRPDPADASRFTLGYESPAARGTIEVRLCPDDKVTVEVLTGPAVNSAAGAAHP